MVVQLVAAGKVGRTPSIAVAPSDAEVWQEPRENGWTGLALEAPAGVSVQLPACGAHAADIDVVPAPVWETDEAESAAVAAQAY